MDDGQKGPWMLNSAGGIRARSLLRRYWVATIALGVFAGVAGGIALGVWGIARRTSTVYERFVAYEGAAPFQVFGCVDGVAEEAIRADYQGECGKFDYADLREFLPSVPGVESVARWTLGIAYVAAADNPAGGWRQLTPIIIDPAAFAAIGRPFVLEGRLAHPSAAFEATVNEEAAKRLGVGIGDNLRITPFRLDQFDDAGEGLKSPSGLATTVTIVGVTRRPSDLLGRLGGTSLYEDTSSVTLGPGFWEAIDGDVANYSIGLIVRTSEGVTGDSVMAALSDHWPGRPFYAEEGPLLGSNGHETVVDAIRLQTLGLYVIAVVVALAALVFAGQTIARQVRREWADAPIFDALGMTRPGMVGAAAVRAIGFVLVSVLVAFIVSVAMSPLGPLGIGRAAEPDPGVRLDGWAAAIGLTALAFCVMISAAVPVATVRRRRTTQSTASTRTHASARLSASALAGLALTRSRRAGGLTLGSAVIGVSLACAAGVAAWSLTLSYDSLESHPARYGSSWDAQVGNVANPGQQAATRKRLESIPGITAVGILTAAGIGPDESATLFAADPFLGDVTLGTITAGRRPVTPHEIALGRHTMQREHVQIGDSVTIVEPFAPDNSFSFDVVGEVVVNDSLSALPGRGGLVTKEGFTMMTGEGLSQTYVVWVEPSADRSATLAALQAEFPTTFLERSTPRPISNLGLVSNQPALLALLVGLLAAAAMVHALVTSVLRGRRQIGVLKTLGFTRRQVAASIAWHASSLAFLALVIGIPLGIVMGRVLWTRIVDNIGVVSPAVISVPAIVVVTLLVWAVANLAALGPGMLAARTMPAQALRTE